MPCPYEVLCTCNQRHTLPLQTIMQLIIPAASRELHPTRRLRHFADPPSAPGEPWQNLPIKSYGRARYDGVPPHWYYSAGQSPTPRLQALMKPEGSGVGSLGPGFTVRGPVHVVQQRTDNDSSPNPASNDPTAVACAIVRSPLPPWTNILGLDDLLAKPECCILTASRAPVTWPCQPPRYGVVPARQTLGPTVRGWSGTWTTLASGLIIPRLIGRRGRKVAGGQGMVCDWRELTGGIHYAGPLILVPCGCDIAATA